MNTHLCFNLGKNLFYRFLLLAFVISSCKSDHENKEFNEVDLGGVKLHYKVSGKGFPLILIHGSLTDLRYWENQNPALEEHFQVISYSRRYNFPNTNEAVKNHSAIIEAEDLLGLMNQLKIEKAYILGHSYGAYTALLFATEHSHRVQKLILAEPPILRWLPEIPAGEGIMEHFLSNSWTRIGNAFLEGGEEGGLNATSQWYFGAPLDSISEEWRTYFIQNVLEWQLLATSSDAFPMVDFEKVRQLNMPTLVLSGASNEGNMNDIIDGQLSQLLPNHKRIIIENAGHEMFLDNVEGSNQSIITFLNSNP